MKERKYIFFSCCVLIFMLGYSSSRRNSVNDVNILLFTNKSVDSYVTFSLKSLTKLTTTKGYKSKNNAVLFIHGYKESARSGSSRSVIKAYLASRPETNALLLDWGNMADGSYSNAAVNTLMVGNATGNSLLEILDSRLPSRGLHIVAYSLGCYVAASIARKTKMYGITLPRITGLDCVFPPITSDLLGQALRPEDALFVDGIHTDATRLGAPLPYGHIDFWPNGGQRPQPGCPESSMIFVTIDLELVKPDLCSHRRSWMYYAESVQFPKRFPAVHCNERESFTTNQCGRKTVFMGYGVSQTSRGNFYLTTNEKQPFGKMEAGLKYESNIE